MRYTVIRSTRFKKAYKRIHRHEKFDEVIFATVVNALANNEKIAMHYKDHQLTGGLKAFRKCHLAPDILLIYQKEKDVLLLTLVSIGNHSQLFK